MSQQHLPDGRALFIVSRHSSAADLSACLSEPFAAMLPAFGSEDQRAVKAITGVLVELGCVEICCVGPEAESLHDAIDWVIEDKEVFGVVTTWHEDQHEGCEYFILAAGGKSTSLVACVQEWPNLAAVLRTVATGTG